MKMIKITAQIEIDQGEHVIFFLLNKNMKYFGFTLSDLPKVKERPKCVAFISPDHNQEYKAEINQINKYGVMYRIKTGSKEGNFINLKFYYLTDKENMKITRKIKRGRPSKQVSLTRVINK